VRVLAVLSRPETVLEMPEVKVVAFDNAERFRMKSLKNDVRSAHEISERRYDSAKPCESLVRHSQVPNYDAGCEPCLRRVATSPRTSPCELEA
jgi:hypothetical protein